ncbi:hypothetical protein VTN00DRAFT_6364 [Thermoascus crustaceus]|uniref:uncharacterized protein n=1 Tax=Thermoascus crustaceus TaxID=5088 RepID=UPI0037427E43
MAALISLLDGPSEFVRRLDYLHDNGITYIGNEPAFLTVYQYHYAGRPAKSALRAHYYIPSYFKPTPDGLPGNDDSGAMGSFVAMSMMGLFPNPGQNVYFITPPFFESVNITSPITKRTARVRVKNFDPTYKNIYIQSATLDGKPYTKNWVDHAFFTEGKELVLVLGQNESRWGTREEDLPPSLSKKGGVDVNILNGGGIGGPDGVEDAGEMVVGDMIRRSSRDTFPLHRYARIDSSSFEERVEATPESMARPSNGIKPGFMDQEDTRKHPNGAESLCETIAEPEVDNQNSGYASNLSTHSHLSNGLSTKDVQIAIIGISARFPGGARSPDALWKMISEARSAWSEVPSERFNLGGFYHPDADRNGAVPSPA